MEVIQTEYSVLNVFLIIKIFLFLEDGILKLESGMSEKNIQLEISMDRIYLEIQ
jgi:hypothetical protein